MHPYFTNVRQLMDNKLWNKMIINTFAFVPWQYIDICFIQVKLTQYKCVTATIVTCHISIIFAIIRFYKFCIVFYPVLVIVDEATAVCCKESITSMSWVKSQTSCVFLFVFILIARVGENWKCSFKWLIYMEIMKIIFDFTE